MKIRVEYDATPVRHAAAQCPACERWFRARDITKDRIDYDFQIRMAQFECPVCGKIFGGNEHSGYSNVIVEECDGFSAVYKDCLRRKEVWECPTEKS